MTAEAFVMISVNRVLVTFVKHAVEHEHAHYRAEESKLAYHKDDNN